MINAFGIHWAWSSVGHEVKRRRFTHGTAEAAQESMKTNARRRPSIRDIADAAGVSPATVSLALNNVPGARIADATRLKVEQMAAKLGYAPNGLAQALRTNRSHTLALISEEIATVPYAGRLIRGAQEAASKHGWIMLIMSTGGEKDVEDREIEAVWRHQVDGVIYADTAHRIIDIPGALDGKPVFLANAEATHGDYWSVFPDEIQGGYIATRELIDAGHVEIGFVSTAMDIPARTGRLRGYRTALEEVGLRFDPTLVIEEASSFAEDGYRGALSLLSREKRPTALFCFNDRMAMGAYRAAAEMGLLIPKDLSVVGFDNQEIIAEALSPQLTTVALPYYEMGAMAVDAMIADLQGGPTGRNPPGAIPNVLLKRKSVGLIG